MLLYFQELLSRKVCLMVPGKGKWFIGLFVYWLSSLLKAAFFYSLVGVFTSHLIFSNISPCGRCEYPSISLAFCMGLKPGIIGILSIARALRPGQFSAVHLCRLFVYL
jgi:hypothetical protein